jgi:hypothetical protein
MAVLLFALFAQSEPQAVPKNCPEAESVLCLNDAQFAVEADWTLPSGKTGPASGKPLTDQTGYFWFFNKNNLEVIVKILDGCAANGHYWIFAAGLTNLQTNLIVEDLSSGSVWTRTNPQGQAFQPIQDTTAFACDISATSEIMLGSVSFRPPRGWRLDFANSPTTPTMSIVLEKAERGTILVSLATPPAVGLEPFSTYETLPIKVGGHEALQTTFYDAAGESYLREVSVKFTAPDSPNLVIQYRGNPQGYSEFGELLASVELQ